MTPRAPTDMKKSRQNLQTAGMVGVHYVAAELSKRGYTALPTTRNKKSCDILAFNEQNGVAKALEVKTCGISTSDSFWLLGEKDQYNRPNNFMYVFVKVYNDRLPDFYVVPSDFVVSNICIDTASTGSIWYSITKKQIIKFKDKWDGIG